MLGKCSYLENCTSKIDIVIKSRPRHKPTVTQIEGLGRGKNGF